MHDMQHTWVHVRPLFPFVVIPFACYGVVVFPTWAGLHCLVVYLWYISTVVRFVTYLFSLSTSYRVVLVLLVSSGARHITYLLVGGRWRCCCLCVVCFGARTSP